MIQSKIALIVLLGISTILTTPDRLFSQDQEESRTNSQIEKTDAGDFILIQELELNASVEKVWAAYTTSEGWQAWVAPVAEVDLRIGGTIRTNYREGGKLTDNDANTLHIVNYVPNRLLTLQAEVSANWPDILKEQEKQMYNVILFEVIDENTTKLTSYGVGYKDTPEMEKLLEFFVSANESTMEKLVDYVEADE